VFWTRREEAMICGSPLGAYPLAKQLALPQATEGYFILSDSVKLEMKKMKTGDYREDKP
jgi:hypothetical protein